MNKSFDKNIIKEDISLKDAADLSNVSVATIRNWIKTGYLTKLNNGKISKNSLEKLLSDVIGKEKLISRANKSKKDFHNDQEISEWLEKNLQNADFNADTLGNEYEKKLSEAFKNKEGIYYTPDEIIENMFLGIDFDPNLTFCDPACGSGNFIMKAIEKGIKPENIHGFDTDENAIKIARKRIYQKTGYKTENIKVGDFLDIATNDKIQGKFDLIFTNPPWGKKIKKEHKIRYGKLLDAGKSLDTTSLFFFAALKSLKNNGRLGFLVQEAFFNIAIFEDIRKHITKYQILRIIDYGKPFKNLMTKAQAIILQKIETEKSNKILCESNNQKQFLDKQIFKDNPKTIFNFWIKTEDVKIIDAFFKKEHTTLKNKAKWALGIVTGNNKKFCKNEPEKNYVPVFKGSDILKNELKKPSCYLQNDFSQYQQVAPLELYNAKEKLIYRFISSELIFFYDNKQRFILNSANLLIPLPELGISAKQLTDLLNSKIMNFVFKKIFNTHKILRADLETLPIHTGYFKKHKIFNEEKFLNFLGIELNF